MARVCIPQSAPVTVHYLEMVGGEMKPKARTIVNPPQIIVDFSTRRVLNLLGSYTWKVSENLPRSPAKVGQCLRTISAHVARNQKEVLITYFDVKRDDLAELVLVSSGQDFAKDVVVVLNQCRLNEAQREQNTEARRLWMQNTSEPWEEVSAPVVVKR